MSLAGRACEILQEEAKKKTRSAPETSVDQSDVTTTEAESHAEIEDDQTVSDPVPQTAPPTRQTVDPNAVPLAALPDEDLASLLTSQGIELEPFDRVEAIKALGEKGITHVRY